MDLRQLEYIVMIGEEGNISKAANKLFITQSALNQQLIKLEKQLDILLFQRTKSKCVPTDAGRAYIASAKEILRIKANTYNKMYDLADISKGSLNIGFTPSRGSRMFASVYPEFHPCHAGIKITPYETSVKRQHEMLINDELDVGFMTLRESDYISGIEYELLQKEELFLAVPSRHPVCKSSVQSGTALPYLDLSRVKEEPFVLMYKTSTIRRLVDLCFSQAGFVPDVLFDTSNTETMLTMIENEICCGFIPAYYVNLKNERIRYFHLKDNLTWNMVASTKRSHYKSKAAKDFISMAKDYWTKNILNF